VAYTLEQLSNGLAIGSIYALIALGYSLVYSILNLINFAHGYVIMVGAFIAFTLLQMGAPSSRCSSSGSPTGLCDRPIASSR
jgi:branched-subunit amino acid ABC-type transport system permease component